MSKISLAGYVVMLARQRRRNDEIAQWLIDSAYLQKIAGFTNVASRLAGGEQEGGETPDMQPAWSQLLSSRQASTWGPLFFLSFCSSRLKDLPVEIEWLRLIVGDNWAHSFREDTPGG